MIALSMLVLNVTSSALVAQSLYYYLVPHFGSLAPVQSVTRELAAECLISTVMTFISQMCFVEQLYGVSRLQGGSFATWAVAITAILTAIFGTACPVVMIVHPHSVLLQRSKLFSIFFGVAKGFGAITDLIATIAMCILLAASRTGFRRTNTLINTLIQYCIQRGILVTLIQGLILIIFFAAPGGIFWFPFHVNVTKLYANTFFSTLNSREMINRNLADDLLQDIQINSASTGGHSGTSGVSGRSLKAKLQRHFSAFGEKPAQVPNLNLNADSREDMQLDMMKSDAQRQSPMLSLKGQMPTVTKTVLIKEL
ncbi:hypothetical protein PHLGIDRAFT_321146 [Phlebiopsis gigantea 11061_1 CR5-6]|uniref:DUF6534 domain-containing protein n=1 Tax=Phlebiopsis gigantea (strain 11061_1 CR5-6) TaxID=745531 RepID=A0A0C3S2N3_PHLG1|nr:hypothetical protein PHLGIDRAFT_321146 [Phlebiopsis gigantea 11061_1 CR5-6]